MTPNLSHVAGLQFALDTHIIGDLRARQQVEEIIQQAKSAPAEVAQGEAVLFSQFLTAVMDAAGLVRHGRQSKELSEYLGKECIRLRLMNSLSAPPSPDAELVELLRDAADYLRGLSLPAQLVKRIDAKLASLVPQ